MATVKCCICFETVADSDEQWVVLSGCGHTLHEKCLDKCERTDPNLKCPLCKARVSQRCDGQVRKILLRNFPVKCYLDAVELGDDQGRTSSSASIDSNHRQTELEGQVRDMQHRLRDQRIQAEIAKGQAEDLQQKLSEEKCRLQIEKAQNTELQRKSRAKQKEVETQLQHEVRAKQRVEEAMEQLTRQLNQFETEKLSHCLSDPTHSMQPHEFSAQLQRLGQLTGTTVNDTLRQRAERNDSEYAALMKKHRDKTAALSKDVDALKTENIRLEAEKQKSEAAAQRATAAAAAASARVWPQRSPLTELPCSSEATPAAPSKVGSWPSEEGAVNPTRNHPSRVNCDVSVYQDDATDDSEILVPHRNGDDDAANHTRLVSNSMPHQWGLRSSLGGLGSLGGGFLGTSIGGSFLGKGVAAAPVRASILGHSHSCGSFIRHGPDGKGGTAKVFTPSALNCQASRANPMSFCKPVGVKKASKALPQIQRRKGAGSRGGAALKMTDFMERDGAPVIRFS